MILTESMLHTILDFSCLFPLAYGLFPLLEAKPLLMLLRTREKIFGFMGTHGDNWLIFRALTKELTQRESEEILTALREASALHIGEKGVVGCYAGNNFAPLKISASFLSRFC